MKKTFILITSLLVLPFNLKADSPSKVILSFNNESNTLKIEASHPVKNVDKHFIDLITILVDGKQVKELTLQKQSSKSGEIVELQLPEIKKGVTVTVKARCNQFGTKKESLKI